MEAGRNLGKLTKLAREVNSVALTKRMFLEMERQKVGSNKIEFEAFKTLMETRKAQKDGVIAATVSSIKQHRDEILVLDLIKLKIKYVEKEEKEVKRAYRKEKRNLQKRAL